MYYCQSIFINNIIYEKHSMIVEVLIGLATGIVAGVVAGFPMSIFFYKLAKEDSELLYKRMRLESVLFRLRQLSPNRSEDSERSKDGVYSTSHWMICAAETMEESGFIKGGLLIREIVESMKQTLQACQKREITDAEAVQKKEIWYSQIHALYTDLPQSRLIRIVRILSDLF